MSKTRTPSVMGPEEALRVLREQARRGETLKKIDFGDLCFPEQKLFVEDDSPFVSAVCGRRAGKSDGAILKALRAAHEFPGSMIPYIALSRPHAKRIAWPKLLQWNRKLDLGGKLNLSELSVFFPRCGSTIMLGGANDEAEIERWRGGAYPLVIIDEAQAFRSFLQMFIVEILLPATLDYAGQIVLIGTPNAGCFGYFHAASSGELKDDDGNPMFSNHHWTGFQNPNIDREYREGRHTDLARALATTSRGIRTIMSAAGLTFKDPVSQREWYGKWVKDTEGLVYQVPKYAQIGDTAILEDADDWCYVLGMDVGFVDATAFVVMAYSQSLGVSVVLESFQESRLLISQQAALVERLGMRYDFETIVVDPGGGGKFLTEELCQKHDLPAVSAEKRAKIPAIQTLNADMKAGSCKIVGWPNQELLHDLSILQWNYSALEKRVGKEMAKLKPLDHLAIDDRTPDHLADAFLYAHRECLHRLHEFRKEGPRPGTPEWIRAEEQAIFDRVLAKSQAGDREAPWWDSRQNYEGF